MAWNPFASLGLIRVVHAALVALAGLVLRSPTITLLGATWSSGVVTNHYLVTFAAALAVEPGIRTTARRVARLPQWIAGLREPAASS